MMVMYSMIHIGWPVSQAQYFAVSSCSTGGHWSIPVDSPDWFFGITGLVVAFGVPIMGVAMATIGQFIAKSKKKELEDIKDTINAPVTPQEIKMMQQFGLEDGDGEVDEAEFIILCMCRLGTDPRIIANARPARFSMIKEGFVPLCVIPIIIGTVQEMMAGRCVQGMIRCPYSRKRGYI